MEQIVFTKAGIIELHATMHERLDLLLRHAATVPDELWHKPISGFGYPSVWKQLVHILTCEEGWVHAQEALWRACAPGWAEVEMKLNDALARNWSSGYTLGMKTAISIPNDLFDGAERLARRTRRSRSRLFTDALREYLARHAPDKVTESMDQAIMEVGEGKDEFVSSVARRRLERTEW